MNRLPPEPLTPEERELARLAATRAGSDGPPPALDAAILASARQALAASQPVEEAAASPPPQRQRPRWPVAMGLAASLLLAVTIAWQLRPPPEAALVQELPSTPSAEPETATDAASPTAESAALPERQAQSMAAPASAPARDAVAAQDRSEARKATPAAPARSPAKPPRPAATEAAAARAAAAAPKRVTPPMPPAPPAPPPPALVPPLAPPVDVVLQPAKPAELRPAPAGGQFAEARAAGDAPVAFPAAAQEEQGQRERGQRRALTAPTPMADVAAGPAQHERPALEPVEVAGARLQRTDLHVPVSADSLLSQREWLERIRTRYGLGDPIAARQSLQLFVQRYPRAPVPEDLRPLLPPSP